jgi:hypothetical protein
MCPRHEDKWLEAPSALGINMSVRLRCFIRVTELLFDSLAFMTIMHMAMHFHLLLQATDSDGPGKNKRIAIFASHRQLKRRLCRLYGSPCKTTQKPR